MHRSKNPAPLKVAFQTKKNLTDLKPKKAQNIPHNQNERKFPKKVSFKFGQVNLLHVCKPIAEWKENGNAFTNGIEFIIAAQQWMVISTWVIF